MRIKLTSGSGAGGLGIVGTGLALALPEVRWIGWLLVAAGAVVFVFDIRIERGRLHARSTRLQQHGPWFLIIAGPLFGLIWLYFLNAVPSGMASVSRLAELGWVVDPTSEEISFSVASKPLPNMEESANYFRILKRPFKVSLQGVKNLDGLHYIADIPECKNLSISAGEATDLSELSKFFYLESISISQVPLNGNDVIDVRPLASLKQLKKLYLGMSRVRSIEELGELKNLKDVYLRDTLIDNINVMKNMKDLETIDVTGTRVTDLSPLEGASKLIEIGISKSQVAGLVSLYALHVKRFRMIEQDETDLSPLAGMKNLEEAFIWGLPKFDFRVFENLPRLDKLSVLGRAFASLSTVVNIEALSRLTQLRELALGSLRISTIDFLRPMRSLEQINFNEIPISSIEPMAGLPNVKSVGLIQTNVIDISPLLTMPRLAEVTIVRTPARADILPELSKRGVILRP